MMCEWWPTYYFVMIDFVAAVKVHASWKRLHAQTDMLYPPHCLLARKSLNTKSLFHNGSVSIGGVGSVCVTNKWHDVLMPWRDTSENPPPTIPLAEDEQLLESKAFALQWS